MNWETLQGMLSELEIVDQIRFADLKGVAVPDEVRQEAAAALAAEEAKAALASNVRFQFGTANQGDRVYLKTKGLTVAVPTDAKTAYGKGLFLESRCIDQTLEILQAAKAECDRRGIPTGPTAELRNVGMDVPAEPNDIRK